MSDLRSKLYKIFWRARAQNFAMLEYQAKRKYNVIKRTAKEYTLRALLQIIEQYAHSKKLCYKKIDKRYKYYEV